MNVVTIAAILASVAFAIAIGTVLRGRAQNYPDWGLAVFREDSTPDEDDPMDAYLEQRAAGNGVLPAVVEVKVPPKIHYPCFDAWWDGKPAGTCPSCRDSLTGAKT